MDNHCHAIGMEILTLDLITLRCPFALLIVKRECGDVLPAQKLKIKVSADGTQTDIIRYLKNNGFTLDIQAENSYQLVIIATKGP
ncbi:sulfurtransferase TusA family protein [Photobacterium toruni]|uniref:SirA-like protein n=1 Tax=Photobacterium toruni TaxID=1935446 RepID=A0A1T4UEW8_9GAMM|nr:sulfurtransferase TusA family protein [Photobacterium toruni]MEC6815333.1 sulfurtransferase TusA family protein [Photobacterium toruni]MEC6833829.1 sulfurtransferase TusA family protein [Photobacterium toruni]SKA51239.1 SirA-like protein [Photobacterium toruni]